jgi:hypothetical protein
MIAFSLFVISCDEATMPSTNENKGNRPAKAVKIDPSESNKANKTQVRVKAGSVKLDSKSNIKATEAKSK